MRLYNGYFFGIFLYHEKETVITGILAAVTAKRYATYRKIGICPKSIKKHLTGIYNMYTI